MVSKSIVASSSRAEAPGVSVSPARELAGPHGAKGRLGRISEETRLISIRGSRRPLAGEDYFA